MTEHGNSAITAEEILSGEDLTGLRFLVTGVSAGLGVETARALVAKGAHVVGTARDLDKAAEATQAIASLAGGGNGTFELVRLDLGSLASVRACADALLSAGAPFHAIIANAGVMATPEGRTEDGFETQFGVNHLGHFVLMNRLSPVTQARVVLLSAAWHRTCDLNMDDPNYQTRPYNALDAYAASKTAVTLFAVEFDRRHRARGLRAVAVHPGAIMGTGLGQHFRPEDADLGHRLLEDYTRRFSRPPLFKTVEQGAAAAVWAATKAPVSDVGGKYCEDCAVSPVIDEAGNPLAPGVSRYAIDPVRATQLWALSEGLVGEAYLA